MNTHNLLDRVIYTAIFSMAIVGVAYSIAEPRPGHALAFSVAIGATAGAAFLLKNMTFRTVSNLVLGVIFWSPALIKIITSGLNS